MRGCGLQCVTTTGLYKTLLLSVESLITKVTTCNLNFNGMIWSQFTPIAFIIYIYTIIYYGLHIGYSYRAVGLPEPVNRILQMLFCVPYMNECLLSVNSTWIACVFLRFLTSLLSMSV